MCVCLCVCVYVCVFVCVCMCVCVCVHCHGPTPRPLPPCAGLIEHSLTFKQMCLNEKKAALQVLSCFQEPDGGQANQVEKMATVFCICS